MITQAIHAAVSKRDEPDYSAWLLVINYLPLSPSHRPQRHPAKSRPWWKKRVLHSWTKTALSGLFWTTDKAYI
jgi:hypothetical protein